MIAALFSDMVQKVNCRQWCAYYAKAAVSDEKYQKYEFPTQEISDDMGMVCVFTSHMAVWVYADKLSPIYSGGGTVTLGFWQFAGVIWNFVDVPSETEQLTCDRPGSISAGPSERLILCRGYGRMYKYLLYTVQKPRLLSACSKLWWVLFNRILADGTYKEFQSNDVIFHILVSLRY